MKKRMLHVIFSVFLFAIMFSGTAYGAGAGGKAGTTLAATKTADGFWVKQTSYDWTISKASNTDRPVIDRNKPYTLTYTLQVIRSAPLEKTQTGVRGTITVTNGGDRPTEGLKIVDQVQYKTGSGPFRDLPGAVLTIVPAQQLLPGETKTFPYEIVFSHVSGAAYKNTAKITITNHSGHLDQEFGPEPKKDFSLPAAPTLAVEDESATITDNASCPAGFTCVSNPAGPWILSSSGTITYQMTVTNNSAPPKLIILLKNTAQLVENTTKQVRSADRTVYIFTGCGCTKP